MKTGAIGPYRWGEFSNETPELVVPDVIRGLARHLIGLRAVNVSWDSGLLVHSDPGLPADWTFEGPYAVSPPVTQDLIQQWPYSPEGFDEWYFFRDVPSLFNVNAFCNYVGTSLEVAAQVPFLGGISLPEQLERWRPSVVVGQGYNIFVIATAPEVIDTLSGLAQEA
jgi:hypothetical protein